MSKLRKGLQTKGVGIYITRKPGEKVKECVDDGIGYSQTGQDDMRTALIQEAAASGNSHTMTPPSAAHLSVCT